MKRFVQNVARLKRPILEEMDEKMKTIKIGKVRIFISLLLITLILSNIPQSSAIFQATIINPQPYTVYAGQVYLLQVDVEYNIPDQSASQYGPIDLWVSSPPSQSSKLQFYKKGGVGTHKFTLQLTAPTQPGTYTLGIKLLANSKQHSGTAIDTATVNYQVILPTVNDWAVKNVWITPDSPVPGDEVTFHATITLKSTTGVGTQTALVGCNLNGRPFDKTQILRFTTPSSLDIEASRAWIAEEGTHRLRFMVEDYNRYRDPYLKDNAREIIVSVEAYYAYIAQVLTNPMDVESSGNFDAVVTVSYKFPGSTQLRIGVIWPADNVSMPFGPNSTKSFLAIPATEETLDTVTGEGNRTYAFNLEAPRVPSMRSPNDTDSIFRIGLARVEFERGTGDGWEITDPGFSYNFSVNILRPRYYAIFNIADITYLGETVPFDPLNPRGRFRANLEVEYFVPMEGAKLRISLMDQSKGIRVYDVTEGAKGIGTRTYPIEFDVPLNMKTKDYSELFDMEVSYKADENWNKGDSRSRSTSVSISEEAFERGPMPSGSESPLKPITDFFKGITDYFKGLFN